MINKQKPDRKEGVHDKLRFNIFLDYVILAPLASQYKESLIYVSRFYSLKHNLLLLFIGMCVPVCSYAHKYSAYRIHKRVPDPLDYRQLEAT